VIGSEPATLRKVEKKRALLEVVRERDGKFRMESEWLPLLARDDFVMACIKHKRAHEKPDPNAPVKKPHL
jgi:hypothetical protein